ncbi:MAG: VOC family protein [Planctomycetaceae bacterium]|nr:VOC family protein [Planctomycetaceae bacterium]
MGKITPFLWFDHQAEEAANFYLSVFKNSKIEQITHYGPLGPRPEGSVMTVTFEIEGQTFVALNGGDHYQMTPATSFVIDCETQEEVDWYWGKLVEGGKPHQCGWLDDKFGVTWQIVPTILLKYLGDPDPEKARRVTEAMFQMVKFDIPTIQQAYDS